MAGNPPEIDLAQSILDSLTSHIAVVDEKGTIQAVNEAWREFAAANGVDPAKASEGANYFDICSQADGEGADLARVFAAGLRDVLDGRREEFCLDYPCHSSEQRRWFRARISPLRGSRPRQAVVTHSNVTARWLIEEARAQNEAILRSVFEIPSLGIGLFELEADDIRFVTVNEATARFFGMAAWEVAGRSAVELGLPRARIASWLESGWKCVRERKGVRFEYVEETPVGPRWISAILCPIEHVEGTRPRLSFIAEDFTDYRRTQTENFALNAELEAQLECLQSLRKIDQAILSQLRLGAVLDVVLDQLVSRIDVDAAAIVLRSPHSPIVETVAHRGYRNPKLLRDSCLIEAGPRAAAILEQKLQVLHVGHHDQSPFARWLETEGIRSYWVVPLLVRGEVQGHLEVGLRSEIVPESRWVAFLKSLAEQTAVAADHASLIDGLRRANHRLTMAYEATVEGWGRAVDLRDHDTEAHSRRVTEMAIRLARELGLSDEEIIQIRRGALLHDIGKIGVPDHILLKPGPLTDEERAVVREHPEYAYSLLSPIDFLRPALDIPHYHHERWDGKGYPRGLRGKQIPLAARLFAVVDIWDALSSDRPYREALPPETVRSELEAMAGKALDPEIVSVFLGLLDDDQRIPPGHEQAT